MDTLTNATKRVSTQRPCPVLSVYHPHTAAAKQMNIKVGEGQREREEQELLWEFHRVRQCHNQWPVFLLLTMLLCNVVVAACCCATHSLECPHFMGFSVLFEAFPARITNEKCKRFGETHQCPFVSSRTHKDSLGIPETQRPQRASHVHVHMQIVSEVWHSWGLRWNNELFSPPCEH